MGAGSWVLWFVPLGVGLWLLLPELSSGATGALTGLFAALRLELNALRQRVERLEREAEVV